jgi:hypothetical protein
MRKVYRLESTIFSKNDWKVETLPLPLTKAETLIKLRTDRSKGNRRYRLVKIN